MSQPEPPNWTFIVSAFTAGAALISAFAAAWAVIQSSAVQRRAEEGERLRLFREARLALSRAEIEFNTCADLVRELNLACDTLAAFSGTAGNSWQTLYKDDAQRKCDEAKAAIENAREASFLIPQSRQLDLDAMVDRLSRIEANAAKISLLGGLLSRELSRIDVQITQYRDKAINGNP